MHFLLVWLLFSAFDRRFIVYIWVIRRLRYESDNPLIGLTGLSFIVLLKPSNRITMLKPISPQQFQEVFSWVQTARDRLFWLGPNVHADSPINDVWTRLKCDERPSLGFWHDNKLVGFAQCYEKHEGARHIACLIVNPQERGKGLGRLFVQALLDYAWQHSDVEHVTLNVLPENNRALNLYRSLGFVEQTNSDPKIVPMRLMR